MRVKAIKMLSVILVLYIATCWVFASSPPLVKEAVSRLTAGEIRRMLDSNRYSHDMETKDAGSGHTLDGFELALENDVLGVYVRRAAAGIRVLDKRSGYVWGSVAEDKPEKLNKSWSRFANSIAAIEYFDSEGLLKFVGAEGGNFSYSKKDGGIVSNIKFEDLGISFEISLKLDGGGIILSVDDKTIREEKDFKLATVSFLPFFGSSLNNETEGYFLLPDGSGALMPFKGKGSYLTGYKSRVYGDDYAIDSLQSLNDLKATRTNDFLVPGGIVRLPVFGAVHGIRQNAYFADIGSGAEYASIEATPSGVVTEYNWICGKFIYRQKYVQPISQKGTGVNIEQKTPNAVNPEITYTFLTGEHADYAGMAACYRDKLKLQKLPVGARDIPLRLDFLAADIEKYFIGQGTKTVTSLKFIENAVKELNDAGIARQEVTLKGWQPGGLNGHSKIKSHNSTVYGGFSKLSGLKDYLAERGGGLSFFISPFSAKEPQLNLRKGTGISLSQSIIKMTRDDPLVYLRDTYFIKPGIGMGVLKGQAEALKKAGFDSVTVDDFGSLLYGEYQNGAFQSRTEVMKRQAEALKELGVNVSLYSPNAYMTGMKTIENTPMSGSQYLFESDSVPFYQLVMSGSVELIAPYANQSFFSRLDILKHIDYNTYPSFILTEIDNTELRNTGSFELHSTRFGNWKDTIADTYKEINGVLKNVYGQRMINREMTGKYTVKVTYETGAVYVNYGSEPFEAGGIRIEAQSAWYFE